MKVPESLLLQRKHELNPQFSCYLPCYGRDRKSTASRTLHTTSSAHLDFMRSLRKAVQQNNKQNVMLKQSAPTNCTSACNPRSTVNADLLKADGRSIFHHSVRCCEQSASCSRCARPRSHAPGNRRCTSEGRQVWKRL